MKKLITLIFGAALLLTGCGKNEDPSASFTEDYRFFIKGQVDGLPFEYNAGENGYFLETDYTLEDSLVVMEGRLFRESEPDRNAIRIRIRSNAMLNPASPFLAEENIKAQYYSFRDATGLKAQPGKYLLKFYGDTSISGNVSYDWKFPEGTDNGPEVERTVDVNLYENYPVTLETSVGGLCGSWVRHHVNLEQDCDATFRLQVNTPGIAETHVISRIGTVASVEWLLDGQVVKSVFPGTIDLSEVAGADTLSCIINFEDGCVKRIDRAVPTLATSPCITDFWYTKEKPTTYDPHQYSTVEIEYLDENGKKYTSYYTQVQGDFKITSAHPYQPNSNNEKTTRFFLETDLILKNADGSTVEMKNAFGSFAVAHP